MAPPVAGGAAEAEFVDERAAGCLEVGFVVVFEEVVGAEGDTGVALAARRVDGTALGVVDEAPDERGGGEAFDGGVRDGGAVVEGAALAADVEDDFGGRAAGSGGEEVDERIGALLGEGRPTTFGGSSWR